MAISRIEKASEHFFLYEFFDSEFALRHGLVNEPPPELYGQVFGNILYIVDRLELIREHLGGPIHINSGYRTPAVNLGVGGAHDSSHLDGLAVDFVCPIYGEPLHCCRAISDLFTAKNIPFDQIIHEFTWVHVGFGPQMRHHCLSKQRAPDGTLLIGLIPSNFSAT